MPRALQVHQRVRTPPAEGAREHWRAARCTRSRARYPPSLAVFDLAGWCARCALCVLVAMSRESRRKVEGETLNGCGDCEFHPIDIECGVCRVSDLVKWRKEFDDLWLFQEALCWAARVPTCCSRTACSTTVVPTAKRRTSSGRRWICTSAATSVRCVCARACL